MPRSNSSRIKPPALRPGDTIGIVAPASNLKRSELEAGCEALRIAGYKPFYFDSILERDLYFAGSLERRIRELAEMFARPDVRAILCARGGYGANYLLEALDLDAIRSNPKIFIGYSDITTLLTFFVDAGGLITFHGPMAAKDWARAGGVDAASWQAALGGATEWDLKLGADSGVSGLVEGATEGILYGGCLSILVASLGTPYEIKTDETILFLEDLAAKPYQVDRMLMQLKLAGKLDGVRGIVFGEMMDCVQNANQGYTLQEVVMRIVSGLEVPVAYGLRSGHVTAGNITLPFGVRAGLTVGGGQVGITILEAAVTVS
ncbi:MAG TPA: LD-carboxypeptidase [Candidatus Acidoferrales bacterium]|jgi:muramoyltetrapeptide carboxypeptidase|nr:LD-carboxypeptidase [Candidatus Acidoferrales bacterium]